MFFIDYSTTKNISIDLNNIKNLKEGQNTVSVIFYNKDKKSFSTTFNYSEEQQ